MTELVIEHRKKCDVCDHDKQTVVVLQQVNSIDTKELEKTIARTRKGFSSHKHPTIITSRVTTRCLTT